MICKVEPCPRAWRPLHHQATPFAVTTLGDTATQEVACCGITLSKQQWQVSGAELEVLLEQGG